MIKYKKYGKNILPSAYSHSLLSSIVIFSLVRTRPKPTIGPGTTQMCHHSPIRKKVFVTSLSLPSFHFPSFHSLFGFWFVFNFEFVNFRVHVLHMYAVHFINFFLLLFCLYLFIVCSITRSFRSFMYAV